MLTPNQFELGFITDRDALSGPSSLDDILAAADEVRALGPATVLVTSVTVTAHRTTRSRCWP